MLISKHNVLLFPPNGSQTTSNFLVSNAGKRLFSTPSPGKKRRDTNTGIYKRSLFSLPGLLVEHPGDKHHRRSSGLQESLTNTSSVLACTEWMQCVIAHFTLHAVCCMHHKCAHSKPLQTENQSLASAVDNLSVFIVVQEIKFKFIKHSS